LTSRRSRQCIELLETKRLNATSASLQGYPGNSSNRKPQVLYYAAGNSVRLAVLLVVDGPPSLRAERHFVKKVLIVVAASLRRSIRGLRHHVWSMRSLFVPEWGGGHLIWVRDGGSAPAHRAIAGDFYGNWHQRGRLESSAWSSSRRCLVHWPIVDPHRVATTITMTTPEDR